MRYVGHLDTMHYFQKAFRRTGLSLGFSKGFSPHMLLTFASPLSIGMTTEGDYLDIVIEEDVKAQDVLAALRAQLSGGFEATAAVRLRDDAKTPMALLRAASYRVSPGTIPAEIAEMIFEKADSFLSQESIHVLKKTKKGEREEDIRPLIYKLRLCSDSGADSPLSPHACEIMCASGSIEHLKPELIMSALTDFAVRENQSASQELQKLDELLLWRYHRTELYGVDPRILKPGDPLGDHQTQPLLSVDVL